MPGSPGPCHAANRHSYTDHIVGMLFGLAPWIVYWVLVGNVPFTTAVVGRAGDRRRRAGDWERHGETGDERSKSVLSQYLSVLTVLTFTLSESFLQQWILPLSNAGVFLVALTSVLIGQAVRA